MRLTFHHKLDIFIEMLLSFVDCYHLIAYFTSKKCEVRCTEKSCGAINLMKQLSQCRWSENEVTAF